MKSLYVRRFVIMKTKDKTNLWVWMTHTQNLRQPSDRRVQKPGGEKTQLCRQQDNHRTSPWWTSWEGLVDSPSAILPGAFPPCFLCSNPSNRLKHWEQSLFSFFWMTLRDFLAKSLQLFNLWKYYSQIFSAIHVPACFTCTNNKKF